MRVASSVWPLALRLRFSSRTPTPKGYPPDLHLTTHAATPRRHVPGEVVLGRCDGGRDVGPVAPQA